MTEHESSHTPLPAEAVASLLQAAQRAQHQGNKPAARTLLRALTRRNPETTRAWLMLALVAETREEQYGALEQALILDPTNVAAARGLERLRQADPRLGLPQAAPPRSFESPVSAPATARFDEPPVSSGVDLRTDALEDNEAERARRLRWPLYAVLGTAMLLLAFVAVGLMLRRGGTTTAQTTSSEPQGIGIVAAPTTISGTTPLSTVLSTPAPLTAAPATAPVEAVTAVLDIAATAQNTTVTAELTSTQVLEVVAAPTALESSLAASIGEIATQGSWNISVLRPQDIAVLSGSIGELQPQGRFVLALVAIGNTASTPAVLPLDLVVLVDQDGNRYTSVPAASTTYLSICGSACGNLSAEEVIPAGGGIVSVPLIFDVPEDASGLVLTVSSSVRGWPVAR